LYFDAQLTAMSPTATPSATCTPGSNPEPGCAYEGPPLAPTPTPSGPEISVTPLSSGRLPCQTEFVMTITNSGMAGSELRIEGITFAHGYSQGDYGRGFVWDVSALVFPVSLARGESIEIPI